LGHLGLDYVGGFTMSVFGDLELGYGLLATQHGQFLFSDGVHEVRGGCFADTLEKGRLWDVNQVFDDASAQAALSASSILPELHEFFNPNLHPQRSLYLPRYKRAQIHIDTAPFQRNLRACHHIKLLAEGINLPGILCDQCCLLGGYVPRYRKF